MAARVAAFLAFAGPALALPEWGSGRRDEKISRETTCEQEYVFHAERCFKQEFAEPLAFCPGGAELDGIDCVLSSEMIPTCPPDTRYDSYTDSCVRTARASKVPQCEDGFDLVQRKGTPACQRVVVTQSEPTCERGFLEGSSCWSQVAMPTYSCDGAEVLDGTECVAEVSYECNDSQHRNLVGHNFFNQSGGRRQCKKSIRRQARASCARGTFKGQSCVEARPERPVQQCAGVYGIEKTCRHVDTMAPTLHCPYGFEEICRGIFGNRCTCEAEEAVASELECPSDFIEYPGGICLQYFPAAVRCPEGFNLDGESCVRTCHYQPEHHY